MNYGHRYKQVRQELDITQQEICKKLEIGQSDWSYLENKGKNLDIEICEKLIEMGANPLFLLTGELPILLPHVKVFHQTTNADIIDKQSPWRILETLKNTQEANEVELKTWQSAYKQLAELVLPRLDKIDNYLSQIAGKKIIFNLVQS